MRELPHDRPVNALVQFFFSSGVQTTEKLLTPIITSRLSKLQSGDNSEDDPTDLLQLYLLHTHTSSPPLPPSERTPHALTHRILVSNFAGIHTTSGTLLHAVLDLVGESGGEWIGVLRKEVEGVFGEVGEEDHGDGEELKEKVDKLVMMDAFLKESLRMNGIADSTYTLSPPLFRS